MHEPVALERALSVLRHARSLGGRITDYTVSVSIDEGFELIDWFRAQAEAISTDLSILDMDIAVARAKNDPFVVLQHYELLGLKISRRLH